MKNTVLLGLMFIIPAVAMAEEKPMTEDQKTLYFLGNNVLARNLKQFNFTPEESKYILAGLTDSLNNVPGKVDESYGSKINELIGRKQAAVAQKEKEKGRAFLELMSKEKNAQKLASGVVFIPVKEGKGLSPKATDMVRVHYHGTFPDGKVFDSSVDRKAPAEFPLNGVIPCWTEGVQKLKIGGKAKLVCPSDTAYGDQGMPGAIPGGATLVFEVELLDIVKQEASPAAKAAPAAAKKAETKPAVKAAQTAK
ncbi:MAG: FKBP-type peptidyl-prolyl cis-trans isomerase [Elusimicrobiales bacterium]